MCIGSSAPGLDPLILAGTSTVIHLRSASCRSPPNCITQLVAELGEGALAGSYPNVGESFALSQQDELREQRHRHSPGTGYVAPDQAPKLTVLFMLHKSPYLCTPESEIEGPSGHGETPLNFSLPLLPCCIHFGL